MIKLITVTICSLVLFACSSNKSDTRTVYQKGSHYNNRGININVALLVKEQNTEPIKPTPNCSGFLVDKTRGIFGSAKHCIGVTGRWKIFYHGKAYEGFMLATPAVSDLVLIQIRGSLDSLRNAPEPYPIALVVRPDDRIFVRGIHPHSQEHQVGKQMVTIWEDYYDIYWIKDKLVFDNLEARVINTNSSKKSKELGLGGTFIGELSSIYYKIKTIEDHKISFGGLSGGPVVNDRGELVGVVSWQAAKKEEERFKFETEEFIVEGKINKLVFRELNVVSAKELEELMSHTVYLSR